jgi:CheY-like chemotaxis protein
MSLETTQTPELHTPATPRREEEREKDRRRLETVRRPVLVVEDDPTHREYLLSLLEEWGYDPIPVGSAEEAEYAVRHKVIEAAVIDVFLPGRSGAALMTRLRSRFPQAVLIGISALGDAGTARRCKGLGADMFLSKPIAPETLATALQTQHRAWH